MAYIPAPNVVRACLQFVWFAQEVEICIAFKKTSAVTVADMDALAADLETWRVANIVPLQTGDITANQWQLTNLTTVTSPSLVYPITSDQVGTGGNSVNNNVTLACSFLTDLRGRSYRGRAYLPGLDATGMSNGVEFLSLYAAAVALAFSALNAAISAAFAHVVVSYQNNNVVRTTAVSTPVTTYRTDVLVDSQRRRLESRGA